MKDNPKTALTADTDWLDRATILAPQIEAAAAQTEQDFQVTPEVMAALHKAEMFRMLLPRSLGGGEATPLEAMKVMEVVAAADASTAWCLGQGVGCSFAGAYLDQKIAREIFGPANAVVAWGPESMSSKAIAVDGGYRATGKWRFASGSRYATWVGGHSVVYEPDGETVHKDANGGHKIRTMMFPIEQAEISNVWQVIGLRGTGSDDYAVNNLFVAEEYTTWRNDDGDRREQGPLYHIPLLTMYGIAFAGIALGLGRAIFDSFIELAANKVAGRGSDVLRENAVIQSEVAQGVARLGAARAFLVEAIEEYWDCQCRREEVPMELRARLRIAITWAMNQGREVADFAYQASGTNGIFENGPFERRFRDMHTVSQQGQGHKINFEFAGRVFLGLPPGPRV